MQALSQLSYNPILNGGGIRDRTVDPLLAKQMLSQLSYTPTYCRQQDFFKFGGAKRDRTVDLLHAMQALSQLSYNPKLLKTVLIILVDLRVSTRFFKKISLNLPKRGA